MPFNISWPARDTFAGSPWSMMYGIFTNGSVNRDSFNHRSFNNGSFNSRSFNLATRKLQPRKLQQVFESLNYLHIFCCSVCIVSTLQLGRERHICGAASDTQSQLGNAGNNGKNHHIHYSQAPCPLHYHVRLPRVHSQSCFVLGMCLVHKKPDRRTSV